MNKSDDMISRQAAFDEISKQQTYKMFELDDTLYFDANDVVSVLASLPSAQPEIKPIDYQDCSNAMLKMWMDNVVTDGEYNRIMDKLNAHWGKKDG